MSEDKYRVQRNPIEASEVSGEEGPKFEAGETTEATGPEMESQAANQAMLERIGQVHEQAKSDGGENMNSPNTPEQPGLKVQGMENAPPQFREALQSSSQMKMQTRQQPRLSNNAPDMRMSGSDKLEGLLRDLVVGGQLYEEIELPSLGKFYDGSDGPTNGKLHVRKMTGEEEAILATPRFVRKGEAVNMIFERCIQENIDPDALLTEDRTYLLIYLRGISYSPNYDVELRCPDTDQVFAETINLNSLFVDNCPPDFDESNLSDTLPQSGFKFKYRLSRGRDETDVNSHRERMVKDFDRSNEADDTLIYRTALLVDHIEGLTDKMELQILLKRLPIADVAYLRSLINEPPFGVDTQVTITSPYTMQEFKVELPLEANFFFPRLRKEKNKTAQA